jgi:hypothetical protein
MVKIQARVCLDMAQQDVLASCGRTDCMMKERECLHAYVSITKAEEAFLKQKARNQWLQLSDQNNVFFHRLLKGRHARNTITHLWDEHGNRVEDTCKIEETGEDFYKKLLVSKQMVFTKENAARLRQLISPSISAERASMLDKDVTIEEIRATIFNMKSIKAHGPDGYPAKFFKSS